QHLAPVGEREIDHRRDDLDAGVADEHVDAAKGLDDRGNAGLDLLLVGDVHGHADGLAAAGLELRGRRVSGLELEVGDGDLGALREIGAGDVLADAAGGAGDDGDFVLHAYGDLPPPILIRENAVGSFANGDAATGRCRPFLRTLLQYTLRSG